MINKWFKLSVVAVLAVFALTLVSYGEAVAKVKVGDDYIEGGRCQYILSLQNGACNVVVVRKTFLFYVSFKGHLIDDIVFDE